MRRTLILTACVLAAAGQAAWVSAGPAAAAPATRPTLLYDFQFAGTHGTVNNSAPGGPAVALKLFGDWARVPGGVHFAGNTTGKESVAAGKPAHGYTLDAPATDAVGFGAEIQYERPAPGSCPKGASPNVTQVGRFTAGAQAKLQLSRCAAGQKQVFAQCRFAGSASAPNTAPVTERTPLVNGAAYRLVCVKAPDSHNHTAITVRVTRLSTGATRTKTFTAGAVGSMQTKEYLSAGNKYPLPKPADNNSQYSGEMSRAVYCVGSLIAVRRCLAANLPS